MCCEGVRTPEISEFSSSTVALFVFLGGASLAFRMLDRLQGMRRATMSRQMVRHVAPKGRAVPFRPRRMTASLGGFLGRCRENQTIISDWR